MQKIYFYTNEHNEGLDAGKDVWLKTSGTTSVTVRKVVTGEVRVVETTIPGLKRGDTVEIQKYHEIKR